MVNQEIQNYSILRIMSVTFGAVVVAQSRDQEVMGLNPTRRWDYFFSYLLYLDLTVVCSSTVSSGGAALLIFPLKYAFPRSSGQTNFNATTS